MKAKRKLLISMLAIVFVLLAVVATIAIAFALTQQTITTTLNIGYVVEDIDGTASATYTIGGVTESLTAMKGDNVIGDTLVFHAGDTEDAGNLMFPEGQIPLSAQNDNIVIQYTYSNTGERHYIASMSFDGNISADNMKVEYSIDGVSYSENRYAVVVPANTSNKSYWIKISIDNKAKSASFTGDFKWLLSGCDEQADSYLSLTSVEMQATGTAGSYKVSLAGTGSYVGELVFPSSVNGDPVTTIAANDNLTQEQMNQVTSVNIPDSVTTIGDGAFSSYQNLQTVTFEQNETAGASVQSGTGLQTIGDRAFASSGLKEIIIPNTVNSMTGYAFDCCDKLISIKVATGSTKYKAVNNCLINTNDKVLTRGCKTSIIPDDGSVEVIGVYAFSGCSSLTKINIPEPITTIGMVAFAGCGLTEIELPSTITGVGDIPFTACSNLNKITINSSNQVVIDLANSLIHSETHLVLGDGVTELPFQAFAHTDVKIVTVGKNVTNLNSAFWECLNLQTATILGDSVKNGFEFYESCNLTSVTFSDNVTAIGNCSFYGTGITEVYLSAGVTSIDRYAFPFNLQKIECDNNNPTLKASGNCVINKTTKTLIYGIGTGVIPADGSVTSIGDYAFAYCTGLTSIELPSSVTSIGEGAFSGCTGLTSITVASGNTKYHSAGNCLIETASKTLLLGCNTSVIPTDGSVTSIGGYAFSGYTGLTSITIPASVTSIGGWAFSGCTGLTSVTFENKTGWKAGSTTITEEQLTDSANAATLLKNTYVGRQWTRS